MREACCKVSHAVALMCVLIALAGCANQDAQEMPATTSSPFASPFVSETSPSTTQELIVSTHPPTITSSPLTASDAMATRVAFRPETNTDWTPIERDFDGVTMVLVPAGCFDMGSTDYDEEQPIHEQCFDAPFWIDKYEVTQAQFQRFGGTQTNQASFSGDHRPVESITWFEASNFCELRDSRLPTEAEWEYAARGPDGLVYPWGNAWNADHAVWNRDTPQGTAPVGSIPAGISWVGALDMSGNVWEWTSSLYEPYPYNSQDGREADTGSQSSGVWRVMRGGAWHGDGSGSRRSLYRGRNSPGGWVFTYGLRCARSYESP